MLDQDTLRSAYEHHNSQISQIQQKVHTMSTGAIGVFLVVIGWVVSSSKEFNQEQTLLLSFCVTVILVISEANIWSNSKSHVQVAKVVYKINKALGFYESSELIGGEALYPEDWKKYGRLSTWKIAWHHMVPVGIVGGLALEALWV
jgi:hypothetical protein